MDAPVSSNESYAYFYMHNTLRFLVSVKGSHQQFKQSTKPGRVTVPHPKSEIPLGTLKSIEKQAGIKLR
jgi:hypothetical protein